MRTTYGSLIANGGTRWGKAYFKLWIMDLRNGAESKQNGITTQGETDNHADDKSETGWSVSRQT